jgi:NAD+ kinase
LATKRVGILFHPKFPEGQSLADRTEKLLRSLNAVTWVSSAWDEERAKASLDGTELIVSIGGDGTILRAARAVLPFAIPIVGVNMGRLGFMTEMDVTEMEDRLPPLVKGEGWIDERTMLEARIRPRTGEQEEPAKVLTALNDVFVGRGSYARVCYIDTAIDNQFLTTFKADGVVLSTATGSTGYCLAAGGPILYPQSREFIIQSVAPHLSLYHGLVLKSDSTVDLKLNATREGLLSIDGQIDIPLRDEDGVTINRSENVTRFLRLNPPSAFYSTLERRLKGNRKS